MASKVKKTPQASRPLAIGKPPGMLPVTTKGSSKAGKGQSLGNSKKVLPQIKKMTDRFNDMICGCLENLPPKPPSEVRIFLSSTFSDMRAERNALAREVYPVIKEYCYNNLDLDFHVVDLRWGINDTASDSHTGPKICLAEIANCQKVSLGPNFVTMLSHRYGRCGIPTEIAVEEFDIIMRELSEHSSSNLSKVTKWYRKDINNIPPLYILQPISTVTQSNPVKAATLGLTKTAKTDAQAEWEADSAVVQSLLRQGVQYAHKKGVLSEAVLHKYYKSVTEQEIVSGILEADSPSAHSVCFIRGLLGLTEENLSDKNATRHIDTIDKDGQVSIDEDIARLISDLQQKKIPSKLPKNKIHTHLVNWEEGGIQPGKHEHHQQYIQTFCQQFTFEMLKMIEDAKHLRENQIPVSEYYTDFDELLHHMHFCNTKCEDFQGRDDLFSAVRVYLQNKKNRKPCIIHACSGAGKTSVMAMLMRNLPEWFGPNCFRMIRFLGTSPDTTDIYDVLWSVIGQLADHHNMILEPDSYRNMKNLVKYIPRFLRNVSRAAKEPIVILLDSIDQLSSADGAYNMNWLPLELPANVHIILSMITETHGLLEKSKALLQQESSIFLLEKLPLDTSTRIIEAYLDKHNRTLPDFRQILDITKYEPTPLFLKLVLDQALQWRSFQKNPLTSSSVSNAISVLFRDTKAQCGPIATSHAICYLTLGLNGLTEVELEDVMSLDDEILSEAYVFHDPPIDGVVHLPCIFLKRILYMLREYLVERRSQGKKTLYWYHRQFINQATVECGRNNVKNIHSNLAQLYLAEEKVIKTVELTQRKKTLVDVDRQITPQPLTVKNRRKLQALPYHLMHSGDFNALKQHCLLNLKFLMTKLKAFNLRELLRDFEVLSRTDVEVLLVAKCLQDMKEPVSNLPLELIARLPNTSDQMPFVSALLDSCREQLRTGSTASLMPLYPCMDFSAFEHHRLSISSVKDIVSQSADRNALIVECQDVDERWKLVDVSANKISTVESQIAPVLSHQGHDVAVIPKQNSADGIDIHVLNSKSLEMQVSCPFDNSAESILSLDIGEGFVTMALPELQVKSYELIKNTESFSLDAEKVAIQRNSFIVDTPNSKNMAIKAVFRIATPGYNCYVSFVTGNDETCQESFVVFKKIPLDEKGGKEEKSIPLPGKILLHETRFLDIVEPQGLVLVSSFKPSEKLYSVSCIDVGTATVVLEYSFSMNVASLDELPTICLGLFAAIPIHEQEQNKLKLISLNPSQQKEQFEYVLDIAEIPTCTFVTDSEKIVWCDVKGKVHIGTPEVKEDKKTLNVSSLELTKGVPIKSAYLTDGASSLVVLCANGELICCPWSQIVANAKPSFIMELSNQVASSEEETDENSFEDKISMEKSKGESNENSSKNKISMEKSKGETDENSCKDKVSLEKSSEKKFGLMTSASVEHLSKLDGVLDVLMSRDDEQLWTLNSDGKLRMWTLPACTLNDECVLKECTLLSVAELRGSVHKSTTEPSLCTAFFKNTNQLAVFCREENSQDPAVEHLQNIAAYHLELSHKNIADSRLYTLVPNKGNKFTLDIYDWPCKQVSRSIAIKSSMTGDNICIKLSTNKQHLIIAMECTAKELDIIVQTVKKNHMNHHDGATKFYALDLQKNSGVASICYRQLTKVPCLANSWEVFTDSFIVMGLNRTTIMWDIDNGTCDQRLIKGTKVAMVYRPEWVEEDHGIGKVCHGKTTCMERASAGDILAVGSEDGFVFAYNIPRGHSMVENVAKKPNHGNSVDHVTVSSDGDWIASYCTNKVLKLWQVRNNMKQCASVGLDVTVNHFCFSLGGTYLTVHGHNADGHVKVFVFEVLSPKKV